MIRNIEGGIILKVETESGSVYCLAHASHPRLGPLLRAKKQGEENEDSVVAIWPDRLPFLLASVTLERVGAKVAGFNSQGTRTLLFYPTKVSEGMILANRRGFKSTRIVKILKD